LQIYLVWNRVKVPFQHWYIDIQLIYAKRMRTSRAALDRLLDADNTSVTLQTMSRAAAALGKELSVALK